MTNHMTDDNDTLRVEIRTRNARLVNAIHNADVPVMKDRSKSGPSSVGTISAFCKWHGLTYYVVIGLCSLRIDPKNKLTKKPIKTVRALCKILDRPVEWLFPEELYNTTWPRAIALEMSPIRFAALESVPVKLLAQQSCQDDTVLKQELTEALKLSIGSLTPLESQVIRMRFGLEPYMYSHTLNDIGVALGKWSERVRQIEAKALRKLRHPTRSRRLRSFLP